MRSKRIPFFGLDRQYLRYRDEFLSITDKVLATGQVLQGAPVAELEAGLCRITGRRHAVAVGSCTDALSFALIAAGITEGDEVIVTSFSFFASVSPILRAKATPVFADIDPQYYMMDLGRLDHLVGPRTRAIIAVHLFGQTLAMGRVEDFAKRHSLALIEDAAQALGASDDIRPAGSMGLASCFSFDPTKVVGNFGSGGALLTDDDGVAEIARSLRYHGRNELTRHYVRLGFNSQLSSESAATLSFKLTRMEEWQQARTRLADVYAATLSGVEEVVVPAMRPGSSHNWHKFALQVSNRPALIEHLQARGIDSMIHYPRPLCDEPLFHELELPVANVPTTRMLCERMLSLPMYADLTPGEAGTVAHAVREFYA
jgi:dTDP-4-amino-4,6-dideoxygalactose transaminase